MFVFFLLRLQRIKSFPHVMLHFLFYLTPITTFSLSRHLVWMCLLFQCFVFLLLQPPQFRPPLLHLLLTTGKKIHPHVYPVFPTLYLLCSTVYSLLFRRMAIPFVDIHKSILLLIFLPLMFALFFCTQIIYTPNNSQWYIYRPPTLSRFLYFTGEESKTTSIHWKTSL